MRPGSVTLVGAFHDAGAPLVKVARYLRRHGYGGRLSVVSRRVDGELAEQLDAHTTAVCDSPVDLAVVAVRASAVGEVVSQLGRVGCRRSVVLSSGFAETGHAALERGLMDVARPLGMRILGPNCQGLWSRNDGFAATFSEYMEVAQPEAAGTVAVVSQSGALGFCIAGMVDQRGLTTGMVLTTGNEVDIDWAELTAFAVQQPGIDTVLAYLEQIRTVDQLDRAVTASDAMGATLAILKGGRTRLGVMAAASHTAALASNAAILEHVCGDLGIILADDIDGLIASAALGRRPRGLPARVAVLTTSGGAGVVAADMLSGTDVTLPALSSATVSRLEAMLPPYGKVANPLDLTAATATDTELVAGAWSAVVDGEDVDAVLIIVTMVTGARLERTVDALLTAVAQRPHARRPVVVVMSPPSLRGSVMERLRDGGIASFDSLVPFVSALRGGGAADALRRRASNSRPVANDVAPHRAVATTTVSDVELLASFEELGLPVVSRVELDVAQLSLPGATASVPGPYALKLVTDDIHKVAVGNVDVGPVLPGDVAAAARRLIGQRFRDARPPIVQVQRYVHAAMELFLGVHLDAVFGPVLTLGLGGRQAEALNKVRHWRLPIAPHALRSGLRDTAIGDLLASLGPHAVDGVVEVATVISEWFLTQDDLVELDVNPVLMDVSGCPSIVDAAGIRSPVHPDGTR